MIFFYSLFAKVFLLVKKKPVAGYCSLNRNNKWNLKNVDSCGLMFIFPIYQLSFINF